ncbi:OmpA family protein [Halovulum dunhuangense]|uniref:OmpA family protein n=1 Tax=Halovulum dunhuangense TaxID=1505036 RepID=A0A849L4Z9_9RHOB|nr:OmpA family protein [Halovulum dunhuangense]NNU81262.1 OmpA family protein [Halovulum dunhuangense]
MKPSILLLCAALAVSACSQGEDPDALFNGQGGSLTGPGAMSGTVIGPDGRPIEVNSIAYFNQVIGDRVLFAVDQSTLDGTARAILDQQAAWLLARPELAITIEGHADEQGTREYNFRLSARRAGAVRDYLVTKGIPDSRLSTVPFGKERPEAVCSDESCWSRNRRAVTVVTGGLGV